MVNQELTFWQKAGIALGFTDRPVIKEDETRAELPILGSPYMPVSAVSLSPAQPTAVSTDRALSLAGVYRAVSIISTSISQLPLGVWRNGEEIPLRTTDLVSRPDFDISRQAFVEQTVTSLAVNGNAYWLLNKSGPTADVKNVSVMNPIAVSVEYKDGKKYYREGSKTFPAWKVKHLMLTRLPGYEYGIGPIQACQNELRGALDLRNYADQWFTQGGIPTGILKTDQSLSPEMADAYRERWMQIQADGGRGVAVLGNGVSYNPVYLSPADAQFLESQSFSQTQIARMFGVPAIYLMTDPGNSMTYNNQEQVDTAFWKYTLMRYASEIEAAFSDLIPRGQEARFKTEVLLRTDQKTRYDAYKIAIDAGFLTVAEVREREGLLPLETPVDISNETGENNG